MRERGREGGRHIQTRGKWQRGMARGVRGGAPGGGARRADNPSTRLGSPAVRAAATQDGACPARWKTERANTVFGNVSRQNQVFAAEGQNLAERGSNPRTFGL